MSAILDSMNALLPRIHEAAVETEDARRLSPALVADLASAGAFRMLVPKAFGGAEVKPREMIEVIESVARADASAGWCVMVGATAGLLSAYVEESVAREIFLADPNVALCGVFAPTGEGVLEESGVRVRGRWSFASGCEHARYRMGGVVLMKDGKPVLTEDGEVDIRHVIMDAKDTNVIDTWDVAGLRGTGSHDIAAEGVLVPESRAVRFAFGKPRAKGALYMFPPVGLLAMGVAAVTLGIARESIRELVTLASAKKPGGARRTLSERELVQVAVGEAEGLVASARAYVLSTADEIMEKAETLGAIDDADKARLRLAATHATRSCARAVDLMYEAGGGTSIYRKSPLQRHLRDVHTATQHAMVSYSTYSIAGRVAMGVRVDRGAL